MVPCRGQEHAATEITQAIWRDAPAIFHEQGHPQKRHDRKIGAESRQTESRSLRVGKSELPQRKAISAPVALFRNTIVAPRRLTKCDAASSDTLPHNVCMWTYAARASSKSGEGTVGGGSAASHPAAWCLHNSRFVCMNEENFLALHSR